MSTVEVSTTDVELVLDFLNTGHGGAPRADLLDEPLRWQSWLADRGLYGDDRTRARAVRAGLRGAVGGSGTEPPPSAWVSVDLSGGTPRLVATEVTGAVLAATARLSVLGAWERMKICPADGCGRAFFDRSRNRSRTWCSMRVCGNREKARAWRERARLS